MPQAHVSVAAMTTWPRYQPRSCCGCGKLEKARTTRKITTIGSKTALTICAQTVSQTRFGSAHTNAAPPNTHAA